MNPLKDMKVCSNCGGLYIKDGEGYFAGTPCLCTRQADSIHPDANATLQNALKEIERLTHLLDVAEIYLFKLANLGGTTSEGNQIAQKALSLLSRKEEVCPDCGRGKDKPCSCTYTPKEEAGLSRCPLCHFLYVKSDNGFVCPNDACENDAENIPNNIPESHPPKEEVKAEEEDLKWAQARAELKQLRGWLNRAFALVNHNPDSDTGEDIICKLESEVERLKKENEQLGYIKVARSYELSERNSEIDLLREERDQLKEKLAEITNLSEGRPLYTLPQINKIAAGQYIPSPSSPQTSDKPIVEPSELELCLRLLIHCRFHIKNMKYLGANNSHHPQLYEDLEWIYKNYTHLNDGNYFNIQSAMQKERESK